MVILESYSNTLTMISIKCKIQYILVTEIQFIPVCLFKYLLKEVNMFYYRFGINICTDKRKYVCHYRVKSVTVPFISLVSVATNFTLCCKLKF